MLTSPRVQNVYLRWNANRMSKQQFRYEVQNHPPPIISEAVMVMMPERSVMRNDVEEKRHVSMHHIYGTRTVPNRVTGSEGQLFNC